MLNRSQLLLVAYGNQNPDFTPYQLPIDLLATVYLDTRPCSFIMRLIVFSTPGNPFYVTLLSIYITTIFEYLNDKPSDCIIF